MKKAWVSVIALILGFAVFSEASAIPLIGIPQEGSFFGAFADFGFMEDYIIPEKLEKFDKLSGKRLAIVAMGSFWGKGEFPDISVQVVKEYGAVPLIFWYPWGPPYEKNVLQQRYSLKNIIDGKYDSYIRDWVKGARASGVPVIVAFAPEMNGDWYTWSGYFNGAGSSSSFGNLSRPDGPEQYIFAYRHVVDVARSAGVRNISWLFHLNVVSSPQKDWNSFEAYYPGDEYVDWIGVSAFGKCYPHEEWVQFEDLFDSTYQELSTFKPEKPLLVMTSVGEFQDGSKAEWITQTFGLMKGRYTRVKAVIWWHDFWLNEKNTYSDLSVDSSDDTLQAFRHAVADPYFIGGPVLT